MVLPVVEHKLTKIGSRNRRRFILASFVFSSVACFSNFINLFTNEWLYTAEVLKYYVLPNSTNNNYDDLGVTKKYFKNATLGPWVFCWLDPVTPFHCNEIDFFSVDDPSDVTSAIEQSVRIVLIFVILGALLDILGIASIAVCLMRKKPYKSLFVSTVAHIMAGICNFLSIIVYMSALSNEVGNKIFPASEMDDPMFYYEYGYSFIFLKLSFLCTEVAALFTVLVYMSKRDERTYNRYRIHSLMKNVRQPVSTPLPDRYHDHSRMQCLQRASRSCSIDASLNRETSTRRPLYFPPDSRPSIISVANLQQMLTHQSITVPTALSGKTMYF
uniref:Uncharacterized protein n=1 Tax=Panagrellus redivivus TaxID=6233 RepID=A0A7E4ZZL9_PANRE